MRVYIPNKFETPHYNVTRWHDLPFHFERGPWTITSQLAEAEVIPVLASTGPEQFEQQRRWLQSMVPKKNWEHCLFLVMMHTHTVAEDKHDNFERAAQPWHCLVKDPRNVAVVHLNQLESSHIHYDFCWHRHQQYYFHYSEHDLANRMWTGRQTQTAFQLDPIAKTDQPRRFMLQNHIRPESSPHMDQRRWLRQFAHDRDCHWSDPAHGHVLPPQEDNREVWNQLTNGGSSWIPTHSRIYNDSWISAYVESIFDGDGHVCITEKTYEPLLRAHYIVPLSTPNYVKALQDRGFNLGSLVDYSYDGIENHERRADQWHRELTRLRYLDEGYIRRRWSQDQEILANNRRVLKEHTQPTLYEQVTKYIEQNQLEIRA